MKITLEVGGTSGAAIAAALATRKEQLEIELSEINASLAQLRKVAEVGLPETKHGEMDRSVLAFIIQNGPYSVSVEQIINGLGISQATTYRALRKLKADRAVVQLIDKSWMQNSGYFRPDQLAP